MPVVSRFFGVVISMCYDDHPPPHFHVRYAEQKARISIDTLQVLDGTISPRALGLAVEWAIQHRDELWANWERAQRHEPLEPIAPLECGMELRHVVAARHLGGHRIEVEFDDGAVGHLDVDEYVDMTGVFAPLRDETEVARVGVDPDSRTLCWPNGADLDPDALYEWVINGRDLR